MPLVLVNRIASYTMIDGSVYNQFGIVLYLFITPRVKLENSSVYVHLFGIRGFTLTQYLSVCLSHVCAWMLYDDDMKTMMKKKNIFENYNRCAWCVTMFIVELSHNCRAHSDMLSNKQRVCVLFILSFSSYIFLK